MTDRNISLFLRINTVDALHKLVNFAFNLSFLLIFNQFKINHLLFGNYFNDLNFYPIPQAICFPGFLANQTIIRFIMNLVITGQIFNMHQPFY